MYIMEPLNKKDYTTILDYYTIPYENLTLFETANLAESILASKLCRCIKKVEKQTDDKKKSIAICTNSILKNRKLKVYKYKCGKTPKLISNKTRKKLFKTSKKIKINNTKRYLSK